jgi:PucR C-terminal helix-turn-helix domain
MGEGERTRLVAQLQQRLPDLQRHILGLAERRGGDEVFALEVRAAVAACLECWLFALVRGEGWSGLVPPAVGLQARRAARCGVSLALLQYVYIRARDMAWNLVLQEIDRCPSSQQMLLVRQSSVATESLFDRILAAIQDAYAKEFARQDQTPEERQARLVYRLLAGDLSVDPREIRFDFDAQHVAVIASGGNVARRALETLEQRAGCRLYCLPGQDGALEAWLSHRGQLNRATIDQYLRVGLRAHDHAPTFAIGDSRQGLAGFCQTYRRAAEASMVAKRRQQRVTFYADVELEAFLLGNQAFAGSLIANYIAPLDSPLKKTLRCYYANKRNATATAKRLDLDRSTVEDRLGKIKTAIGRPLGACHTQIELALYAADLGIPAEPQSRPR